MRRMVCELNQQFAESGACGKPKTEHLARPPPSQYFLCNKYTHAGVIVPDDIEC